MKILTNKKSYQLKAVIEKKDCLRSYYLVSGQSMTTSGQIVSVENGIHVGEKPKRVNRKSESTEMNTQDEKQTMEIEHNEL
jgi:hypothetical protein